MTPRIIEDSFSERLLGQLKDKKNSFKMDGMGPVSEFTHPALMKIQLQFDEASPELDYRSQFGDYSLLAFKDLSEAMAQFPETPVFQGHPFHIWEFRQQWPQEALIHFENIGTILLSKSLSFAPVLVPYLHHYTLPVWLDYALSVELWGPAGKWTRFHERLHTIFANSGLLVDQDFPGFYPLKKESQWLEKHGFFGLQNPQGFTLIPTWDFPLTGLIELEKVLARGP